MPARVLNVLRHEPVSRHDFVEPGKTSLVRMTVITRGGEDLFYVSRNIQLRHHRRIHQSWPHKLGRQSNADSDCKYDPASPDHHTLAGLRNLRMDDAISSTCVSN